MAACIEGLPDLLLKELRLSGFKALFTLSKQEAVLHKTCLYILKPNKEQAEIYIYVHFGLESPERLEIKNGALIENHENKEKAEKDRTGAGR